jgi:hypothetical protein
MGKSKIKTVNQWNAVGRFAINGLSGSRLALNPSKLGYRLADSNSNALFSLISDPAIRFVSNPTEPQIVRLWREKGGADLIEIEQEYLRRGLDGKIQIDLITGETVESGDDLTIYVKREAGNKVGSKI